MCLFKCSDLKEACKFQDNEESSLLVVYSFEKYRLPYRLKLALEPPVTIVINDHLWAPEPSVTIVINDHLYCSGGKLVKRTVSTKLNIMITET